MTSAWHPEETKLLATVHIPEAGAVYICDKRALYVRHGQETGLYVFNFVLKTHVDNLHWLWKVCHQKRDSGSELPGK